MRISDAKVGDVLRSNSGAVWVRLNHGAVIALLPEELDEREAVPGSDVFTLSSAEADGPFTRLVPEKEGDDAK